MLSIAARNCLFFTPRLLFLFFRDSNKFYYNDVLQQFLRALSFLILQSMQYRKREFAVTFPRRHYLPQCTGVLNPQWLELIAQIVWHYSRDCLCNNVSTVVFHLQFNDLPDPILLRFSHELTHTSEYWSTQILNLSPVSFCSLCESLPY